MRTKIFVLMSLLLLVMALAAQETKPSLMETRGVWVDKSDVHKGKEHLLTMLEKLKQANFNAVYFPTYYKGMMIYPGSKFVPQDPELKGTDLLKWLIDEAHKRGLFVEAWPEYGFYTYHTQDATKDKSRGPILDKYPELTAIDIEGQAYLHHPQWGDFYSLCPSNPKAQEIMTAIFVETITLYPVDGINLDRIRYPRVQFCFCPYCKEHFKKDTDFELSKQSLDKEKVKQAFIAWRKKQLNDYMARLSTALRQARPKILISADVWEPKEIDKKGQDWPTWLKEGYIDVAIPMMYWKDITQAVNDCISLVAEPRRIVYGLSAEVNSPSELQEQIKFVRTRNGGGVILWYLGKVDDDLPELKQGVYKSPARVYSPLKLLPPKREMPAKPPTEATH